MNVYCSETNCSEDDYLQKYVREVEINNLGELTAMVGVLNENINVLAAETDTEITVFGGTLSVGGQPENVDLCVTVINKLIDILRSGESIDKSRITYCVELAKDGEVDGVEKMMNGVIAVTARGKQIKYKTFGQKKYIEAIKNSQITFAVGPAGTGKTYLAVAMAVTAYKNKEVDKIILTRPAVEAGERLGFLPGDLQSKVDPYLRPLYDALQEMFGPETYQKLMERGSIEIAPLAYMRGRTLSNAFIILDEAQNTTKEQMKMFLTRMGEGSRMVITGDVTQIDLPDGKASGLKHAVRILKGVEGIATIELSHKDVVRHPLVMRIIKAYTEEERKNEERKKEFRGSTGSGDKR